MTPAPDDDATDSTEVVDILETARLLRRIADRLSVGADEVERAIRQMESRE